MASSVLQTVSVERETSQLAAVTVYSDRAELTRVLKGIEIATEGQTTVKLLNVSKDIDRDSIRVEGSGDAKILDVSYEVTFEKVDEESEAQSAAKKLQIQRKKALEELKVKLEREQLAQTQIETRKSVLERYTNNCIGESPATLSFAGQAVATAGSSNTNPQLQRTLHLTPDAFFDGFFTKYTQLNADLSAEYLASKDRIKAIKTEMDELSELIRLNASACNTTQRSQQVNAVCVIVEADRDDSHNATESTVTIDLSVTYVVMRSARWTPLYDARMYSDEGVLKLTYHANVVQNTGEDWTGCKLTLSTASVDNLSGEAPVFDRAWSITKINHPPPPQRSLPRPSAAMFGGFGGPAQQAQQQQQMSQAYGASSIAFNSIASAPATASVDVLDEFEQELYEQEAPAGSSLMPRSLKPVTAEARAGLISANYVIPGLTNIPSDNNAHKVTVALIDFTPKLEYVAVPKKAEKAYLMAKIVNDSPYTLLAGACSVFLNHSFVSKSQLPLVLPKSTFSTSLGVDPAVKVSYRPAHSTHSTNAGGLLYKATNMDKFDRRIVIHNRRVTPITIRVVDQLPTSRTDDVLVKLVEPKQSDIITFDSRVERDKALDAHDESEQKPGEERLPLYTADVGTIEWHLNIPDNQTREVNLQFSVMYPKDVRVEGLAD
ncbi:hypothetical protein RI367_004763 [Sorochytrium milnesiophthora]